MSAIGFLILLVLSIALLMVLIMKVKLHPTFSLFTTALVMGLVMGIFEPEGFSFTEVLTMITSGFGSTLGSMGIPVPSWPWACRTPAPPSPSPTSSSSSSGARIWSWLPLSRSDGLYRFYPRVW